MNPPGLRSKSALSGRFAPYAIVLALTLGAFLAATLVSYRIDTDTGFQLRSLQQWTRGESPNPGTLRLPDPRDLSRDDRVWSSWWPPGFPLVYAPLVAAGLPLAAALRITSFLLFLAGSLGWLRLADRLAPSRPVRLLYALSLVGYAVTLGGAASLRSADILAFAAAPWLIALTLRLGAARASALQFLLGGFALGLSYWLKYSLFLAVLPLGAWLAFRVARSAQASRPARVLRLAVLALGFALPVAGLIALNLTQSEGLVDSAAGNRSISRPEDLQSVRAFPMAVALAGAPGLGFFQNHMWITYLVYFSDARFPFLHGLAPPDRLLLVSLLGIPGTAALVWGLVRERRRKPGDIASLALAATAGFYLILTVVSLVIRYNYLANEPRLAVGLMPFTQCLALSGWLSPGDRPTSWGARGAVILLLVTLFAAPLAFCAANFLKNDLGDRLDPPYVASATGLFMPEISPRNAPDVEARVAAALRSPRDVVVLAGPPGWGSSFMMWLELPQRTLPVSTWDLPLGTRYLDAAELRGTRPLVSSQDLRVVLVLSHSLPEEVWLPRLQARFPQARSWQRVPMPAHAAVAVWRGDLEAR